MISFRTTRQLRAKTPGQSALGLPIQDSQLTLSFRAQRGISLCRVRTAEKARARFLAALGMTVVAGLLLNPIRHPYAATPQQTAAAEPEYLSPVELKFSPDGHRLYVVCEGNDSVLAIDARRYAPGQWHVYTRGGRDDEGIDAVAWAARGEELGAGEILLTSMDTDGVQDGFDCALTRAVSKVTHIPIIASGGAGKPEHFVRVLTEGCADAALAASIFHYQTYTVNQLKEELDRRGIPVRPA